MLRLRQVSGVWCCWRYKCVCWFSFSTFVVVTIKIVSTGIDFEDPSTDLGDRRFRISYAGGIDTAKEAMVRFHRFWPTWMERVRKAQSS